MNKLTGVACLAVGIVLLIWGHNVAQAVNSQVKNIFVGEPTDKTMYLYIENAMLCAVGVFQLIWKKK